jgi:putative phosphoribosyl transferase
LPYEQEANMNGQQKESSVDIPIGGHRHAGILRLPTDASAIVLFAHGSGSSRLSRRNNYVAGFMADAGIASLLFDLLTEQEDTIYEHRFDIDLLAQRLLTATEWITTQPEYRRFDIGYFGASTGAAAALKAAAELGPVIRAVVSRGGRPDLVGADLSRVAAPTLLIVGGNDEAVIELNRSAFERLSASKALEIVPGATHLFEEPGTLEEVARLATRWFRQHLISSRTESRST